MVKDLKKVSENFRERETNSRQGYKNKKPAIKTTKNLLTCNEDGFTSLCRLKSSTENENVVNMGPQIFVNLQKIAIFEI